jgi:hypothetical protein
LNKNPSKNLFLARTLSKVINSTVLDSHDFHPILPQDQLQNGFQLVLNLRGLILQGSIDLRIPLDPSQHPRHSGYTAFTTTSLLCGLLWNSGLFYSSWPGFLYSSWPSQYMESWIASRIFHQTSMEPQFSESSPGTPPATSFSQFPSRI